MTEVSENSPGTGLGIEKKENSHRAFLEKLFQDLQVTEKDKGEYLETNNREGEYSAILRRVDERSFQNIRVLIAKYAHYYLKVCHHVSQDQFETGLIKHLERVRRSYFLSYNFNNEAFFLSGLATRGKIKSITEFNELETEALAHTMDNPKAYIRRRKEVEKWMGITDSDNPPVYAGLGAEGSPAWPEQKRGACPGFGNGVLVLKKDISNRVIYTFQDSMRKRSSIEEQQLNLDHALIAKALRDFELDPDYNLEALERRMGDLWFYVEAQVLGGVRVKDIKEIILNKTNPNPRVFTVNLARRLFPGIDLTVHQDSHSEDCR